MQTRSQQNCIFPQLKMHCSQYVIRIIVITRLPKRINAVHAMPHQNATETYLKGVSTVAGGEDNEEENMKKCEWQLLFYKRWSVGNQNFQMALRKMNKDA